MHISLESRNQNFFFCCSLRLSSCSWSNIETIVGSVLWILTKNLQNLLYLVSLGMFKDTDHIKLRAGEIYWTAENKILLEGVMFKRV